MAYLTNCYKGPEIFIVALMSPQKTKAQSPGVAISGGYPK